MSLSKYLKDLQMVHNICWCRGVQPCSLRLTVRLNSNLLQHTWLSFSRDPEVLDWLIQACLITVDKPCAVCKDNVRVDNLAGGIRRPWPEYPQLSIWWSSSGACGLREHLFCHSYKRGWEEMWKSSRAKYRAYCASWGFKRLALWRYCRFLWSVRMVKGWWAPSSQWLHSSRTCLIDDSSLFSIWFTVNMVSFQPSVSPLVHISPKGKQEPKRFSA